MYRPSIKILHHCSRSVKLRHFRFPNVKVEFLLDQTRVRYKISFDEKKRKGHGRFSRKLQRYTNRRTAIEIYIARFGVKNLKNEQRPLLPIEGNGNFRA